MKEFLVKESLIPYLILAFKEENVVNYQIKARGSKKIVLADCSGRVMKKCQRRAEMKLLSEQTGIRHLSREDVYSSKSGIIPQREAIWFEKARL